MDQEYLTDDYVAALLVQDARNLAAGQPASKPANKPKPNTRFLQHIIRDTDSHNAALLAKEAQESRARLAQLERDEREKQKARDREPHDVRRRQISDIQNVLLGRRRRRNSSVDPVEDRSKHPEHSAKDSKRRHDTRNSDSKARRRDYHQEDSATEHGHGRRDDKGARFRRRSRSRSRSPGRKSRKHRHHSSRSPSPRRSTHHTKASSGSPERRRRRHDRRSSRSASPDGRERKRRSRSPLGRHRRSSPSKSAKRRRNSSSSDSTRPTQPRYRPNKATGRLGTAQQPPKGTEDGPAKQHDREFKEEAGNDSDPLETFLGPKPPAPVQVRGRGATRGRDAMNRRFSASYDPKADIEVEDGGGALGEDALEAFRDRQKFIKDQERRLRTAGFTEAQVKLWKEGGQPSEDSVRWSKAGQKREWDKGKTDADLV